MTLGRPLPLSDATLRRLAAITEADRLAARALFRAAVPRRFRDLLESPLRRPGVTVETPYTWDPSQGRYVATATGRPLDPLTVRNQVVEPLIRRAQSAQRALSSQLQAGEIALAEWERGMIDQVKAAQTAAGLAAVGGDRNASESDREEIAAAILLLLLLLRDFGVDIARKRQPLNGLLVVRSDLYARAARGTYEDVYGYYARTYLGQTQERRVLGDADHCHTDDDLEGCVELAAKGWRPIGTLPRIGKSPCRSNCRCHKEYR